jgi:hypothetical protein
MQSPYEVDAPTLTEAGNKMGAEAGSVTRTVTALDLYSMDTDPNKIVKVAVVEIDLVKKMPKWKQFDDQCDAVKKEWNRFFGALDKHENNHLAKYVTPYTNVHSKLLGISEDKANAKFDAIDKAANKDNEDYDTATDHGQNESPSTKINFVTCGLEKVP